MPITVTITMNEDGSVNVTGPLEQKLLVWGLLSQAMFLVAAYEPKKIMPVGVLPFPPAGRG